jgi:cytochrome P450
VATIDYDAVDFHTDRDLVHNPYPYYEHLRAKCPVVHTAPHGAVAVTGYDEVAEIFHDDVNFSACNTTSGVFLTFDEPFEGDDVTGVVARGRGRVPGRWDMVTMDPPEHTRERSLLMRVITPKRLKENEDFMHRLAEKQLDTLMGLGRCEFITAYSQPFSMLAVADVLGVPEQDHEFFRQGFGLSDERRSAIQLGGSGGAYEENGMAWLDEYFSRYIDDRRRSPRRDVMTDLALATYPDGSTPEVFAAVRIAAFLFAAGQETTARLLAIAVKYLAEYPELQVEMREHPEPIANFIEECLRFESPSKANHRLAVKPVTVAGVDIAPGTPVVLHLGAANRDPRRFECPNEFRLDRDNAREHLAFARGIHSCPGGPLARAEGKISVEHIVQRMRNIRISEEHHGPPGARRFENIPVWALHGMKELHIEFDPA